MPSDILTVNGGSSSIKLAVFATGEPLRRRLSGHVDRLGDAGATLTLEEHAAPDGSPAPAPRQIPLAGSDRRAMVGSLLDRLAEQGVFSTIGAFGHRVVHGMHHTAPEVVTLELLEELRRLGPYDPDHLPLEILLIEAFRQRFPDLPQVACFDTAFHRTLPRVARMLPLPRRLEALGVQRYGFHGLSYEYLLEELARVAGPEAAQGRVILAHLGSGASLAAALDGRSVDTSMGFTPASGLMMGTRSGDLDPGLVSFLQQNQGMSAERFATLVNRESGLLGVSEVSSDMRDLLAREATDVRAAEAIELFCYQARKWIGAFAAVLGGLDTLVFSAGIGENCPSIRDRICAGLGFLGVELDAASNAANAERISVPGGRAAVYVLKTDEERMIARSVRRILAPFRPGGVAVDRGRSPSA